MRFRRGVSQKSPDIPSLFARVAKNYDRLNHLFSFYLDQGWRARLIREVSVAQDARVIDVCTGTGDLAILLAKQSEIKEVIACDVSSEMLSIARQKAQVHQCQSKIVFVQTDIMSWEILDVGADLVCVAFGWRNLPDFRLALDRMRSLVKQGGQIAILEFAPLPPGIWQQVCYFYLRHVIPLVADFFSGASQEYVYLAESIRDFLSPRQAVLALQEAGFCEVRSLNLFAGLVYLYLGKKSDVLSAG